MRISKLTTSSKLRGFWKAAKLFLLGISFFYCLPAYSVNQNVTFGTYITSIYNIDSDRSVFSADLWLWSKSKIPFEYKIKENLDISYLSSQYPFLQIGESSEVLQQKTYYTQKKIQGTFLHDFDLTKFPFDRQKLKIYFEDASLNHNNLQFSADSASGYDPDIEIDGWKVVKISNHVDVKHYKTNFGNFTKPDNDEYSRVILEIVIKRDSPLIFLKITLGLFAAVLVAMFSTFMSTESDDLYSARLGLLGATLLAVVVNQQFADSKIGQTTTVTLIDSLHMLGFATVFILFIASIISRKLELSPRWGLTPTVFDRSSFVLSFAVFSLASFALIYMAITS